MDILERLQQRVTKMIKELEERLKKARTVQWILFQADLTFLNQVQIQNRHFYSQPLTDHSTTHLAQFLSCARGPTGNLQL